MRRITSRLSGAAILALVTISATLAAETPTAVLREAPLVSFPAETDCNSPAHWDGATFYLFNSAGKPKRSSGADVFHLGKPIDCPYNNQANGGRWIECTWKAADGTLYGWYHHEPGGLCPGTSLTAPRIGAVRSKDNGATLEDLGTILEARPGTLRCDAKNGYFAGGHGDFSAMLDPREEYLYLFFGNYAGDVTEQGVGVARMRWADRDAPAGKVFKWHQGQWEEKGLGGRLTPIFPAKIDWARADADAFWGPSIHWNTHLEQYVILLNRTKDKPGWPQEGIYITFNKDLANPGAWSPPRKIHDKGAWYPQVIGLDTAKHETDKLAGRIARFFMGGKSQWEIVFSKPAIAASPSPAKPAKNAASARKGSGPTRLGIRGATFTLDGDATFLMGISYYGALGATDEVIRQDLDAIERFGFNWIRVWATWGAADNDVSAVDAQGHAREPYLSKLRRLVAECDRRRLAVDVTLSRGNGAAGPPRLSSLAAHRRAVETIVAALKPQTNWYLDLANERNIRDARYVAFSELRELRAAVRRLDPQRLVTASHAGDISRQELRDYIKTVEVDFVSPHRPRHSKSPGETQQTTRQLLAWMKELGRELPVHYQEPFRRGYSDRWSPTAADFETDLRQARLGGAAGWCFHNGDQRDRPDGQPRRSFDLRRRSVFEQLDAEEKAFVLSVSSGENSRQTALRAMPEANRHPARGD